MLLKQEYVAGGEERRVCVAAGEEVVPLWLVG